MRVATFDLDPQLGAAIVADLCVVERDAPGAPGGDDASIAAALEVAEAQLAEAGPHAALIAGSGDWALAAALACAKAVIPFAHTDAGGWLPGESPAAQGAHVDRLAALRLCASEARLDGLARAGLGEGSVIAGEATEATAAIQRWLDTLGAG